MNAPEATEVLNALKQLEEEGVPSDSGPATWNVRIPDLVLPDLSKSLGLLVKIGDD